MDKIEIQSDLEQFCPTLIIPKKCTTLETDCTITDNVLIDLSVWSPDTEGNQTCIYSGFCNIKLVDDHNATTESIQSTDNETYSDYVVTDMDSQVSEVCNQSQVWIDPTRSPFVYNRYEMEPQNCYQAQSNHITVEHHNTYITQNVYNYNETLQFPSSDEFESNKLNNFNENVKSTNLTDHLYAEDEYECGIFLSQMSEEIINAKENKEKEERKYIGLQSENEALKQLMSPKIQSLSRQHKTILFLGHDSYHGQTIQKIDVSDPSLKCVNRNHVTDHDIKDPENLSPTPKRYQCNHCKQIFDRLSQFKEHMVQDHGNSRRSILNSYSRKYTCYECGKSMNTQEKFELHCMKHGDPELECTKCHKVFASKATLRIHDKIHNRKYNCDCCRRTYLDVGSLSVHMSKSHNIFNCSKCKTTYKRHIDLVHHQKLHDAIENGESISKPLIIDIGSENDIIVPSPVGRELVISEKDNVHTEIPKSYNTQEKISEADKIREANAVIAKVMSNSIFLHNCKKKHLRKFNKVCDVCHKGFDRVGDLKRHLIEHIIKSTLAKIPASNNGTLNIRCEVCQTLTFTKIDKYKAHLREHAKLTLYKCTFCDKSFSDSSNFSKHKKIHGDRYYQCDLCSRKFNSKKMISRHMEYHNKNPPVSCVFCDKIFHFVSSLKKHMKCTHANNRVMRVRCQFCNNFFKSMRAKWDHEWLVHGVRKIIVDCLICGAKFRKYAELKYHCNRVHDIDIPQAKVLSMESL